MLMGPLTSVVDVCTPAPRQETRLAWLKDVTSCWGQWLLVAALAAVHTCITFLLEVPGCPRYDRTLQSGTVSQSRHIIVVTSQNTLYTRPVTTGVSCMKLHCRLWWIPCGITGGVVDAVPPAAVYCRGYLGPGGMASGGRFANCTGGAAGYIDRQVLGSLMYHHPTAHQIYNTHLPYDPEGKTGPQHLTALWPDPEGKTGLQHTTAL